MTTASLSTPTGLIRRLRESLGARSSKTALSTMAPTIPQFSVGRTRSYLLRLPLFTRLIVFLIVAFWIVSFQSMWDVRAWGSLIPKETGLATRMNSPIIPHLLGIRTIANFGDVVYRTNTFPLIHAGFFHALLNVISLTPLLERFEAEHGTLTSVLLFFGRELINNCTVHEQELTSCIALSTIPAIIYVLLERGILRGNTAVLGAR